MLKIKDESEKIGHQENKVNDDFQEHTGLSADQWTMRPSKQ